MKKIFALLVVLLLGACVEVGKFTPETHALYDTGHPDCDKTPEKCVHGVPW